MTPNRRGSIELDNRSLGPVTRLAYLQLAADDLKHVVASIHGLWRVVHE